MRAGGERFRSGSQRTLRLVMRVDGENRSGSNALAEARQLLRRPEVLLGVVDQAVVGTIEQSGVPSLLPMKYSLKALVRFDLAISYLAYL